MLISANFTALVDSLVANKLDDVLNAKGQPRCTFTLKKKKKEKKVQRNSFNVC